MISEKDIVINWCEGRQVNKWPKGLWPRLSQGNYQISPHADVSDSKGHGAAAFTSTGKSCKFDLAATIGRKCH